ncbi:hypothetical protein [Methylocaldum szegediense]|jgi:hypothetical protein|uniref:Protein NO VEIN C-terminal domain-containing protein n=1 Tax=Methylocaldum szegediense TaxID=73780 RepID=A0ABM9HWV6_9GAMM|nr:hypothetical protein [Methylocaldum szegediense]CAI8739441.1 conserved protein of unknown function [Methylocaldum szegediense]
MPYTLKQLGKDGPQYAMAMLLRCIDNGEPFLTYGAIAEELEYQLSTGKIFSTHIGHVAGSLMNRILEVDPGAPLINVLITRPNGIPGNGVAGYLADRYPKERLRNWDKLRENRKLKVIQREREKIFNYKKWRNINKELFGNEALDNLRKPQGNEHDYLNGGHGGEAESEEHKELKIWVSQDPRRIGLHRDFGLGKIEVRLQSGDEVDVVFSCGNSFRMIEVKSRRSSDEDFKRGIYQCVKYREVKKAEHAPYEVDVQAILVTEAKLNQELRERARLLGVTLRYVNTRRKV